MPAKRNFLPKPCPECPLDYGSLRIGVFVGRIMVSILVRIKHYNPVGYAHTKKQIEENTISKDKKEQTLELMKSQQKWCSARIDKKFAFQFEPKTERIYSKLESRIFRRGLGDKIINDEWKPSQAFFDAVKKYGWNVLPRYSDVYHRRKDFDEITSHIRK